MAYKTKRHGNLCKIFLKMKMPRKGCKDIIMMLIQIL